MRGCKDEVPCCVTGYISTSPPQVSICQGELGQVASEAYSFPGRECDILMI